MSTQAFCQGFELIPDACSNDVLAFHGGSILQSGKFIPVQPFTVYFEDAETRYIEVNAQGVTSSNTTGFTTYSQPLWEATTLGGLFTEILDWRGGAVRELKTYANDLNTYLADGKLTTATLSVSATATKYAITAGTIFRITGVCYYKGADAAVAFTSANTINTAAATCAAGMWGAWSVNVAASGTLATVAPAQDQTYLTEASAVAALTTPAAGTVKIGHITVNSNIDSAWTANTDDLTAGSDCIGVFWYQTPAVKTLPTALP